MAEPTHDPDDSDDVRAPRYAHRPRPFAGDVEFRLEPDSLVIDSGRRVERFPYRDLAAVGMWYRPTNITAQGYRARIRMADGRSATLSNLSWKTYFEVERQDESYRLFLQDLVRRAGAANPAFRGEAGRPAVLWFLSLALGAATMVMFGAAIVWAVSRQAWALAGLALLFCLPFAWQAWNMAIRNRPARFTAGRIPETVLPPRP